MELKMTIKMKVKGERKKVVKWASSIFLNKFYRSLDRKLLWRRKELFFETYVTSLFNVSENSAIFEFRF